VESEELRVFAAIGQPAMGTERGQIGIKERERKSGGEGCRAHSYAEGCEDVKNYSAILEAGPGNGLASRHWTRRTRVGNPIVTMTIGENKNNMETVCTEEANWSSSINVEEEHRQLLMLHA
jgi:hypothetical protein